MTLEEIKVASIEQVEARTKELRELNLDEVENYDELSKEIDALKERRMSLLNDEKAKKEIREKIADGTIETRKIKKPMEEERKMELTKENYLSSKEYRSAFCKNLLGRELNTEERAAIALAGANPVVPVQLQNSIISKAKEYAPVLNDITLLHVNGAVKFAVEGEVTEATNHTENAAITASTDTLVEVSLSTYEITKLIQISSSVKSMAIDAFEAWIVDMLAQSLSMKIESLVFKGTGSGQAKGIDKITWNTTNSVTVAKAGSLTAANVFSLVGLLKTGYARNAKFYMNRTTLFNEFLPLEDKSKNSLVVREGNNYYVLGIPVELTDSIANSEAILGDMKKYVANMAEEMHVVNGFDIDHNAYKYLGVCQFDGKPAIEEAFVKLVKSAS